MSNSTKQNKRSVPSTIMLKNIPGIGTLTQMVPPLRRRTKEQVIWLAGRLPHTIVRKCVASFTKVSPR